MLSASLPLLKTSTEKTNMDSTAVSAIRDLAYADKTADELASTDTRSGQVIVPKDYQIVDLEKFEDTPNRFRGKYKTHLTHEFSMYVNTHNLGATSVFIDAESMEAKAIIDMAGDEPQWGDHRAEVKLKKTPEYYALLAGMEKTFGQLEFIDFVEDWFSSIVFFNDDVSIVRTSAITAIRKMSVNSQQENVSEVGDFKASLSATDRIEAIATTGILPDRFTFTCDPYDGLDERVFECRLRAMTDDKKPSLKFRIVGLDRVQNEIAMEFKETLTEALTIPPIKIHCGTMEYQGK
jgi:uncharacterized protein YfdQ (DUF2303 family)